MYKNHMKLVNCSSGWQFQAMEHICKCRPGYITMSKMKKFKLSDLKFTLVLHLQFN